MSRAPFASFQNVIFFAFLTIVTVFLGYLLKPFFFAIFWAVLIAAIFAPLNRRLTLRFKRPNLSAGLTLASVLVAMILPLGLLVSLLVAEAIDIYASVHASTDDWVAKIQDIVASLGSHPLLAELQINEAFIAEKSIEVLKAGSDFLVRNLTALTSNTVVFLLQFAVMLYCLYYFLRDSDRLVDIFTRYLPVDRRHTILFISEFLTTAKATLKFTFVIGGLQGFLGGLIFYIVGIERALVWGVLMLGLSVVPAVGCSLIWAPAGVILLVSGHIWQGLTVLIFGAVVISSVDTLLRPVLLGRDIRMHSLLIFLSTLGGLSLFGFSGFVLGPVIASLFLAIWKLFAELYRQEEAQNQDSP